ncbi:MAG: tRNA glutamyl-Q(34) synthetase GluQRS [Burkholderiaceae bacterium]
MDKSQALQTSQTQQTKYVGRFAPSPTGPLHLGSVIAALASFLDARAHHGQWLVRIDDIDGPREQVGAAQAILRSLQELGMTSDLPVIWQSQRNAAYEAALHVLISKDLVYPCSCSRSDIAAAIAAAASASVPAQNVSTTTSSETSPAGNLQIYPGTCRNGVQNPGAAISCRLRVTAEPITWSDRPGGFDHGRLQTSRLDQSVGDFTVRRSDGLWTYQLTVVVDDAFSGITSIVRGEDLADSTARQVYIARCLGISPPTTLHIPVLNDTHGLKLSKQNGAPAVVTDGTTGQRIALLNEALVHLELPVVSANSLTQFWKLATAQWAASHWMDG